MGQIMRSIQYNTATKVISGEGLHHATMSYFIDDPVTNQDGAHTGAVAPTGQVTVDAFGKWAINLTALSLASGTHTIRFKKDSLTTRTPFVVP